MFLKKFIILILLAVNVYIITATVVIIVEKIKDVPDVVKKDKVEIKEVIQHTRTEISEDVEQEQGNEEKQEISYRNILFQYRNSRPNKVFLVGDFNDWEVGKDELKKGKNHTWSIVYKFTSGTYYYNYVVDDKWIQDPYNTRKANKGPVGKCSILIVKLK